MSVRLKLRRKLQTWAEKTLPIRWFEPWMRGGDCLVFSADPLVSYVKDLIPQNSLAIMLSVLLGQVNSMKMKEGADGQT